MWGNFRMSHPGPCWGGSAPAAAPEVAFSPTESLELLRLEKISGIAKSNLSPKAFLGHLQEWEFQTFLCCSNPLQPIP